MRGDIARTHTGLREMHIGRNDDATAIVIVTVTTTEIDEV
jgi:hypothetical protein